MIKGLEDDLSLRIVCSESILIRVYRVVVVPTSLVLFFGALDIFGDFQWTLAVALFVSGTSGLWIILILSRNRDIPRLFVLQGESVQAFWSGGRATTTDLTDVAVEASENHVLAIQYVIYLGADHFPVSRFARNIEHFVSEVVLRGADLF